MLDNWVFIVTNSLILLTAVVGEVGLVMRRRDASRPADAGGTRRDTTA